MRKIVAKEETNLFDLLTGAGYSRTKVKQLLKHRAIAVGALTMTRHDHRLLPGDEVLIRSPREAIVEARHCPGLEIVYEDNEILVIDKPAGLLTIATARERTKTAYYMLNDYLAGQPGAATERIFIVHRLDRDTSGLLVFAKNEIAKRVLQENWSKVDKKYSAVVEGVPAAMSGQVAGHLRESKALRVHTVKGGQEGDQYAVTGYTVLQSGNGYSLLDIDLVTGRKNQIRVHMADLGHPVAGDRKYGAKTDPLGRLALHGSYLAFAHPVTGKRMEFTRQQPDGFLRLFSKNKTVREKR
ncbi:MAG: hypothetical protein A2521_11590 [Deltaproteobacteria bacterium RIFOXYD12_FULL_57_12]|nr:MAG: hypothetical protein A2521_11590 [Deltaproteobacteria bacterium RIFOXYD12_FULL_57_12]